MNITVEEFLAQTGAETVGDTIIIGVQAERRVIGFLSPVFTLNSEGADILAALEAKVEPVEAVASASRKRTGKKADMRADVVPQTGVTPSPLLEAAPVEPVVEAGAPVVEPVVEVPVVEVPAAPVEPVVEVPVVEAPAVAA